MICSTPNAAGGYDYYRSRLGVKTTPLRPALGALAMPLTDAMPRLPGDAVFVGRGAQARGVLCLGDLGPYSTWVQWLGLIGLFGVSAYVLATWKG